LPDANGFIALTPSLSRPAKNTKTEHGLDFLGLSTSSNAGIEPWRPLTIDSRIEARSEP